MTAVIVDAHHHFWDPTRVTYPWLTDELASIRRPFGPGDLAPALAATGVNRTVLVQTRSSLEETREFLQTAHETSFVAGVVGWVDLTDPNIAETIDAIRAGDGGHLLVGIRHQVHDEPDPTWLDRADVRRGMEALGDRGLVYDLLLRTRELPAATRLVRDFPTIRFVVDHLAKPAIATGQIEPWAGLIRELGPLPNVWCKVSGMVTEAAWTSWRAGDLQPYVDQVLSAFGPQRLLFGSDWPVCLLAATYQEVLEATRLCLAELSPVERDRVFGGNAIEVYKL